MSLDKYKLIQFANQNLISIQVFSQYVPNLLQSRTCRRSVKMQQQSDHEARAARRDLLREADEEEVDAIENNQEEEQVVFLV